MTSPVDLPDFFRGDQWSTPTALIFESNVNHDQNPVAFGPFNVLGWESVVIAFASTDRLDVTLFWYADAAGAQLIGKHNYQSSGGTPIYDVVPIIGPYLVFSVTYHAGAGTVVTSTTVFPRRGVTAGHRPTDFWSLSRGAAVNIAAGGNVTGALTWTTTGRACLAVQTVSTSWYAVIFTTDKTGTINGVVAVMPHDAGDAVGGTVEFLLPAFSGLLQIVNRDAAIRAFYWSVTLDRFS